MIRVIEQLIDESTANTRVNSLNLLERAVNQFTTSATINVVDTRFQSVVNNSGDLYYIVLIYYENVKR